MRVQNYCRFPNLRFYNSDNKGHDFGVFLVKGTYIITQNTLEMAEEQAPIVFDDKYHGETNTSSLWIPSDLVAKKAGCDIILNAVARTEGGIPRRHWSCGITIDNGKRLFSRELRVTGRREWVSSRSFPWGSARAESAWRLSEPDVATEVPLRYEHAYGGLMPTLRGDTAPADAFELNPIGIGLFDPAGATRDAPIAAPQILAATEPELQPGRDAKVAGFGPIPPAWLPRRAFGGTYDEHWKREVWPNWPADYSFEYNNSANPDMIYPGFLNGDERIVLSGFDLEDEPRWFVLPGHRAVIGADGQTPPLRAMDLDTLLIDIADADPSEHRVFVSWRLDYELDDSWASADKTILIAQEDTSVRHRSTRPRHG